MPFEMMYLKDYLVNRPIDNTRKFLRGIYEGSYNAGVYETFNAVQSWQWCDKVHKIEFERGLEIGCGMGTAILLARKNGLKAWGVDFAFIPKLWKKFKVGDYCFAADANALPFKDDSFDFVIIPDVLEHIPEWDVLGVLWEMRRVGSQNYYALIDLQLETKPINNKLFTHITIKSEEWWRKVFVNAGFHIKKIDKFVNQEIGVMHKVGYMMGKQQPSSAWEIEVMEYGITGQMKELEWNGRMVRLQEEDLEKIDDAINS